MNLLTEYLWEQINQHIKRFFTQESLEIVRMNNISFVSYQEAILLKGKLIAIPIDIPTDTQINIYRVPFNNTQVTLWNRIPKPEGHEWLALPNSQSPIWYQHNTGTVIPAFNLFSNLIGLLTFREEADRTKRDSHGRFIGSMSSRDKLGLLEIPVFNEAVALLVAACCGITNCGTPIFELDGLLKKPIMVLSHDNDLLLGNDILTQGIRLYRMFLPVLKMNSPNFNNFSWIIRNAISPRKYYYDDIAKMIKAERQYNYTSSFYFLNGKNGRRGARSGSAIIYEAMKEIPDGWNIGIHYNYNTLLNNDHFDNQKKELENIVGRKLVFGRSHYLRFDPLESFNFLFNNGIFCDETGGYPDRIGYRYGIAGPFQPYDIKAGKKIEMWELPLVIMDKTLIDQYPTDPVGVFRSMLIHLSKIGGAITLLYHPGYYDNPEFPNASGLYDQLLSIAAECSFRGVDSCTFFNLEI